MSIQCFCCESRLGIVEEQACLFLARLPFLAPTMLSPALAKENCACLSFPKASTTSARMASDVAQNSDLVRLFALANVAMADAGKFCWKEKYRFELWRPLSGVRENQTRPNTVNNNIVDPFWNALGAPDTNSNRIAFKPPFPAYPSGHATFGAACFQMARLFYRSKETSPTFGPGDPDAIAFDFVSEELDGVSRDLYEAHDPSEPIEIFASGMIAPAKAVNSTATDAESKKSRTTYR